MNNGHLKILIPEDVINYAKNPSLGIDATGYGTIGVGVVGSRDLDESRFGRASYKVICPGTIPGEGAEYTEDPSLSRTPLAISWYVRGWGGQVFLQVSAGDNGDVWSSDPLQLNHRYWQRLELIIQLGAVVETDLDCRVLTYYNQNATYHVDGLQIEPNGYVTTYADGDLELELPPHDGNAFFEWVGQRHATRSFRTSSFRMGGRYKNLTQGLDVDIYPTESSGLGMPPIVLGIQTFTKQEKSTVQSVKAQPRSVGLTFHARRSPNLNICPPESLKALNRARRALEDVIKPDLVQAPQSMILRYEDGPVPMDLEAHYEAGMEWSGDLRDPFLNSFAVRFLCPDPYWRADSQDTEELVVSTTISGLHPFLVARLAGEWTGFGSVNFPIKVARVHPNGDVYIGGAFTTIDGTTYNRVARWDGEGWNVLNDAGADGIDDGEVRAIAFDSEGNVYFGGTFTLINAVSHPRVTKYDPSADTFSVLDAGTPGVTGPVNALAVAGDNTLYLGGSFITTGAAVTVNRICSYNPTTDAFSVMGGGPGLDAEVFALEMDLDFSTLFIGGQFTHENGVFGVETLPYICQWNGTAYSELQRFNDDSATGCDDIVRALKIDLGGRLYLGGDFGEAGFWDAEKIAYWDRSSFYPLGKDGDGLSGGNRVNDIDIDSKGLVYLAGDFTGATLDALGSYLCTWNGTRFGHGDAVFANECFTVASKFDKLFVGYDGASLSAVADVQDITNYGKATAYPFLDVLGPLVIKWLENQSTGAIIRLNLDVQEGERVLIDFRRGMLKAVSEWRGNVISGISPDSDFGDFNLLPGDNRISFLGTGGDGNEEVSIRWQVADWSFDDIR